MRVVAVEQSQDDRDEFARSALKVMQILHSMPVDELRLLMAELESNRHKMN